MKVSLRESLRIADGLPEGSFDGPMAAGAIDVNLSPALDGAAPEIRLMLIAQRILAALANAEALKDANAAADDGGLRRFDEDDDERGEGSEISSEYDPAFLAMDEQRILSDAQAKIARQVLSATSDALESRFFGSTLRQREFAIFQTLADGLQLEFTKAVERAVRDGLSQADFLLLIDDALGADALPFGMDAYLENVYRTESANAFGAQRDDLFNDPDLEPYLWGHEFFNPDDDRSRDSHAKMNGVRIRRGGAADEANKQLGGGPPWSYQCRCVKAPIIVSDPGNPGFEETEGAVDLIRAIERFDS